MNFPGYLMLMILMAVVPVLPMAMADEGALLPRNLESLSGFARKLEPDRFLTSGGMQVKSGSDVIVEPEFGVSHVMHQRDAGSGYEDINHIVHAQAGGRVKLSDFFYLGFATKLPLYNYGKIEGDLPGVAATSSSQGRQEYELLRLSPNDLTVTGEVGFHLGQRLDLNLYYDQNLLKGPTQPGVSSQEEVIGSRFILRFE